MIRICYENFATGTHDVTALHGKAVRGARGVTLYLLPGLTAGQRRRAIRRLRQEASRGFGPPLPSLPLAIALGRDRLSMTAKTAGAAVRLHPAVTLLPGALLVMLMTLFVMAASGSTGGALSPRTGLAESLVGTRTASAWYTTCPQSTSGSARYRSCGGQLAWQRVTPGGAPVIVGPPTAHRPGPRDLAW